MEIKKLLEGRGAYKQDKVERPSGAEGKAKAKGADARESDTVVLSEEARLRGQALQAAHLDSGVRAERVMELKARVQAGSYQADPRKVAENLLREDLDLFV